MKTSKRITKQRAIVLDFLSRNPGANAAEVDRACRTARGGHQWMYALVCRALRAGLIVRVPSRSGRGQGLAVRL